MNPPGVQWPHRKAALDLLLIVAAYVVFGLLTARGIFNGGFTWDEGLSEYIPWRVEAGRQIAAGFFPFFTKNVMGGMPLFSLSYVGVLYPPNLLYAIFPPQVANWLQLFHTLVGGMGMFCYLRARRFVRVVSFIGGLLFIANTFIVLHAGHIAMREAAMLAPWVALAALRVTKRPTIRRAAVLALALALQIAAGYLQITFFTVVWIAIDWLIAARRTRGFARATGMLAAGGIAGFALMAIQILPTMQHIPQTPRVHMTLEQWQIGSFSPAQALTFLIPRAFGMTDGAGIRYPGETIVTIPAIGWILAALSSILLLKKKYRDGPRGIMVAAYSIAVVAMLFLAAGKYYTPNAALFHLPPFNMFRVPARWLFLANTLACVTAAAALQFLIQTRIKRALILLLTAALLFVLGQAFVFSVYGPQLSDMVVGGIGTSDGRVAAILFGATRSSPWRFIDLPIFSVLLSTVVGFALLFLHRFPRIIATLVLFLLGFDNYINSKYGTGDPIPRTEILSLKKQPLLNQVDPKSIVRLYGLSPHGDNPGEYAMPHDTALFPGIPTLNGYTPLLSDRLYITLGVGQSGVSHRDGEYYDRPIPLRNVAVSHLIVQTNALTPERRESYERGLAAEDYYKRIASVPNFDLLTLKNSRSRFDLATQWTPPNGNPEKLDTYVFHNDPGAPLPPTLLENPDWHLLPPADKPIHGATVNVLTDDPSHQRVTVHAPEGAVLLVRDVYWKGWMYKIEGLNNSYHDVGRAEGVIRYVPVPIGDWEIDMKFVPPGWKNGFFISIITAILMACALYLEIRINRRAHR
ncbi:MAG: hypothetical protein ABI579_04035 [Candidatus Sumerlaeota bacterium]